MKKFFAYFALFLFMLICFIMIFSCNSYKKQLKTYRAFSLAHTDQAALICSQLFPVKDSIGKTTVDSIHLANNINYLNIIDSLKSAADMLKLKVDLDTAKSNPCATLSQSYQSTINSLKLKVDALSNAYKPCKPDIVYKTQTIYKVDVAALTVEQNKNKLIGDSLVNYKTKLKEEIDNAHSWRKYALIAFGIIFLSIIGTVLKVLGKI